MSSITSKIERRLHPRFVVEGRARIRSTNFSLDSHLRDLSSDGALVGITSRDLPFREKEKLIVAIPSGTISVEVICSVQHIQSQSIEGSADKLFLVGLQRFSEEESETKPFGFNSKYRSRKYKAE